MGQRADAAGARLTATIERVPGSVDSPWQRPVIARSVGVPEVAGFVLARSRLTGVRYGDGRWSFAFCALDDDTEIVSVAAVRRDRRIENLHRAAPANEWCLDDFEAEPKGRTREEAIDHLKIEQAVFVVGYADGTDERFAFANFRD